MTDDDDEEKIAPLADADIHFRFIIPSHNINLFASKMKQPHNISNYL